MKQYYFAAVLILLLTSLTVAQNSTNKQRAFDNTLVLTVGGGLSQGETDYLDTQYGVHAFGAAEYIFGTSSRHIFGLKLSAAFSQIEGKFNLVLAPEKYKSDLYYAGLGFTYNYAIENRFFPFIYGGISYQFFYPDVFGADRTPRNELVLIDKNKQAISFDSELGIRFLVSDNISLITGLSMHFMGTDNADYLVVDGSHNDFYVNGFVGISLSLFTEKDSDGDGLYDSRDNCPDQPEDYDGYEDADGCPDKDNDHDGILDINDACPNKAEDFDGFEDTDGCPDLDNDKDGIPDSKDLCPDDAEDKDGYDDTDGCPDLDNDKDGILDTVDKCPNEPETYNGFEDTDGCPDEAPKVEPPKEKPKPKKPKSSKKKIVKEKKKNDAAVNAPKQFLLHGEVTFLGRTATIRRKAYKELDRIVNIIKKYPSTKWRIEGHMDKQDNPDKIRELSSKRAQAILNYFISKGLPASQFQAVGMGDSVPVASNATAYGRMKNRRIVIRRIR